MARPSFDAWRDELLLKEFQTIADHGGETRQHLSERAAQILWCFGMTVDQWKCLRNAVQGRCCKRCPSRNCDTLIRGPYFGPALCWEGVGAAARLRSGKPSIKPPSSKRANWHPFSRPRAETSKFTPVR
jgi:hypothetical protein